MLLSVATAIVGVVIARTITSTPWMNPDNYSLLAWASEVRAGEQLSVDLGFATPHPLPVALLVPLTFFDITPLGVFARIIAASVAMIVIGSLIAAYRRGGPLGAAIALVVLVAPATLWDAASFRGIDLLAAGLVAVALAVPPTSMRLRIAVLVAAGLVRPEIWLVPALLVLVAAGPRRPRLVPALVAGAITPALWVGFDLIATGNPFVSVDRTDELAALKRTATPVLEIPAVLGTTLVAALGALGALAAYALVTRTLRHSSRDSSIDPLAAVVAVGVPLLVVLELLQGYPLRTRYLLMVLPAAAVEIAAGVHLIRGLDLRRPSMPLRFASAAVALAALGIAAAHPTHRHAPQTGYYANAATMLKAHAPACATVGVVGHEARTVSLIPPIAVHGDRRLGSFVAVRPGHVPAALPSFLVTRGGGDMRVIGARAADYERVDQRPGVQLWQARSAAPCAT